MSVLIEALRERMSTLSELHEQREQRVSTGWSDFDEALGGGLSRRGVHEWIAVGDRMTLRLPPMGVLIHLAWQAIACERARACHAARVVWIGRACHPPAQALMRGVRGVIDGRRPRPDAALLHRSLFVDANTAPERAWAVEQAARCPGVCAVIGDGAGFDAGLSRRVQLAAQGRALVLLARLDRERDARSVSLTRWLVAPRMDDDSTPERSWVLRLLRSKQVGSSSSLQGDFGAHGGRV